MTYRAEAGDLTMVLTGDAMPARSLTSYDEPEYTALLELLRGADVAFANLETTVREGHEGTPILTQGTPMSTPPALVDELAWMGIDLVSCANNHATDYGVDGLIAMLAHLRRIGMPHAGAGENLAASRKPAFLDTAAGRVALVAATSFFPPWTRAADQRPDARGRPGVNPLGFSASYTVDDDTLAVLRRASDGLGLKQQAARHRAMFFAAHEAPSDNADSVNFLGARFTRGNRFSVSTKIDKRDAEENLRWISEAKRQADFVIFSFHNHEFGDGGRLTAATNVGMEEPAEFATEFARAAIDAGADAVAGHGPHLTLGAEIYKDRPILYSLGNFVFQNDNVATFPAESYQRFGLGPDATPTDFLDARTGNGTRGFPAEDAYWHGLAAECRFKGGKLAELKLHPLDLGFGKPRSQRGRPLLARGATATAILDRVARLSQRYGAKFTIQDEIAVTALS
jgi:poly-gamma-glutamate synthesis protein (capsule biosynthesis protein)